MWYTSWDQSVAIKWSTLNQNNVGFICYSKSTLSLLLGNYHESESEAPF